jgi:hypothetical protein
MKTILENWKQELAEYGELHNDDCCVNDEDGCDFIVKELECCEKMKTLEYFISNLLKELINHLSYDMNFKDEAQRKAAVKMYFKHLIK